MDGKVVITAELDTSPFDAQIDYVKGQMESVEDKLKQADMGFEVGDVQKLEAQYEKLGLQLDKLNGKKQEFLAKSNMNIGFENVKNTLKDVGKGLEKNIKKVKRWALAIFGIRGMYMALRQTINMISQNDEKLKADIDYIKAVVAYTLEPVIRTIVEWAKILLQYIAYIISQWTGKDIFGDANKKLKNANKQVKELKKQLAGFDEVNVMSASSSANTGTNVGGNIAQLDQGNVPVWLKWIVDNKDLIKEALEWLGAGIVALKLGEVAEKLGIIDGFKFTSIFGLSAIIKGIIDLIQSVIDYFNDPSWENFGDILMSIGTIVGGLALLFMSLPLAIASAIIIILAVLASFWNDISRWLNDLNNLIFKKTNEWMDWMVKKLGWFSVIPNTLIGTITGVFTSAIDGIRKLFDGLFGGAKNIVDGIIKIFKGDLWGGLKLILQGILNMIIGAVNFVIEAFNLILSPIRALIVAVGKIMGKSWSMSDIKIPTIPKAKLATGGIVNNPAKGVDMGSYVAGERGREGVIPLTDPSAMSQLGQEIARYVNINNAVELSIDSRRLGRVMQQSQMNSDFARNV